MQDSKSVETVLMPQIEEKGILKDKDKLRENLENQLKEKEQELYKETEKSEKINELRIEANNIKRNKQNPNKF